MICSFWRFSVVKNVRMVSNKNFPPKKSSTATTQVVISRLARLISKLDLIDRDVIHECSCSDSWSCWLEPKSNIFIRAGTKTWIWTFINNSYHVNIRITWIVRFLLHVFTVRSCDSRVLFVKQFEVYFGTVPERRELWKLWNSREFEKNHFFLNRTFFW